MASFRFWKGVQTSFCITVTATMIGGFSTFTLPQQTSANEQPRFLVTLVRHGETPWNAKKILQGHSDIPLSDIGRDQAMRLGKHLKGKVKFTKAYSSDLVRAYNTASLILMEAQDDGTAPKIITDIKLRERNFGDAEGETISEYHERARKANISYFDFVAPGSETPAHVRKRAGDFFNKICELSTGTVESENVLIVSHGVWIFALMGYLNECSGKRYRLINFFPDEAIHVPNNTGVAVLHVTPISSGKEVKNGLKYEVELLQVNNIDHLK